MSYKINKVAPLDKSNFYEFVMTNIKSAEKSIFASVFIIDPRLYRDIDLDVRNLIKEIHNAKNRNVEVKIIHGSTEIPDVFNANYVAHEYLKYLNIETKYFYSKENKYNLHSKYILIDEELSIVGSSNWSINGLKEANENSVAVYSNTIAKYLATDFNKKWSSSKFQINE